MATLIQLSKRLRWVSGYAHAPTGTQAMPVYVPPGCAAVAPGAHAARESATGDGPWQRGGSVVAREWSPEVVCSRCPGTAHPPGAPVEPKLGAALAHDLRRVVRHLAE
jgi:hypothetical protein